MKKRSFGLIALVSLLAIVIVFYAVIRNATKDSGGGISAPSGDGIYLDRQPSGVERVTYRTGGSEFTIRLDGNVYVLDEDVEFPLDADAERDFTASIFDDENLVDASDDEKTPSNFIS